MKTDKNTES